MPQQLLKPASQKNGKEATQPKAKTAPNGKASVKTNGSKATDVKKGPVDEIPAPPTELRALTKKTVVIDARRLEDQKFTDTIRYIKDNPNVRLKLQNTTINPEFVVKILKTFKDAGVIDQIRDIGFVMLPGGDENLILNEKAFSEKVLPLLGYLEAIEISCLGISDKFLETLAQKVPHLTHISLFGVGITDKTVTNLAKKLPNLSKIFLVNSSITSKSVPTLIKEFPYLKALGISGQHFKDADYLALREGLANILSFSAVGQKFEKMQTVKDLLMAMPKLHTLNLSESNINDEAAYSIADIPRGLQNLNISETQVSANGIKKIVKERDLVKLWINNLKGIGDEELMFIIQQQPGLKLFHFAGAYFTDETIIHMLLQLPALIDMTIIPAKESTFKISEGDVTTINLKQTRLQTLHTRSSVLLEKLLRKLQEKNPRLRIELVP